MDLIKIRRMSAGELDGACEVIGLAFADNPTALAVVRGDQAKAQQMMQTVVRMGKLGRRYSHVLVAEAEGRLVGVLNAAQWPHCQLGAVEKLKAAPAMIRVMVLAAPKLLKILSLWARQDPRKPHWHLGPIGVRPELQGQGVGKTLLRSFLEMVDAHGSPAYLETDVDRNVVLYEKFGFVVIAREDFMGIDTRFMWRAAQRG